MAHRHKNKWLSCFPEDVHLLIDIEELKATEEYGDFNSWHELYGVLMEEIFEFFEGVRQNDPDPLELAQIAGVCQRGIKQLCALARDEMEKKGRPTPRNKKQ